MESVTVVGRSPKVGVKAQLVIKDFLEEIVLSKPGQCRISDPFLVGDASMVIKVYPNGFKEKSKGHVSVILYNESDTDVSVRYQVITIAKYKKIKRLKGKKTNISGAHACKKHRSAKCGGARD